MFDCCAGPRGHELPRGRHDKDVDTPRRVEPGRGIGIIVCVRVCVCVRCACVPVSKRVTYDPAPPYLRFPCCHAGLNFKAEAMSPWHSNRPSYLSSHPLLQDSPSPRELSQGLQSGVGIVFDTGDTGSGPQGDGLVVASGFPVFRHMPQSRRACFIRARLR